MTTLRDGGSAKPLNHDFEKISVETGGSMKAVVGIVIVSYNASTAVRVTLASLRQAKNQVASKVLLIDNASNDLEREKIREAFKRHVTEAGLPWIYNQQEKNLGFSGGNNVGIRAFLEDDEVSHICLLNSDVIVTDHWLDRLIEKKCDIISPVTNKADSEQCVPANYDLQLDDCLDGRTELLHPTVIESVGSFAESWYQAWHGNIVEADATFFCVLLSKEVVQRVGLLDETFFPGGYEDDDYCLRARGLGYKIYLARDVFIHHWGSASFGQLQYEYFNSRALRNRQYLENKHGFVWKRRPERPFVSYAMDIRFALNCLGDYVLQKTYNQLYTKNLNALLNYFESEFRNIRNIVIQSGKELPNDLRCKIAEVESHGSLADQWAGIVSVVEQFFEKQLLAKEEVTRLLEHLDDIANSVYEIVDCNIAMHTFLQTIEARREAIHSIAPSEVVSAPNPILRASSMKKLVWLLKHGIPFLWNFSGIVFFGGYPYPERQSDGYFQRIQIIDRLFTDRWRVYVESDELSGRDRWFDHPEPKVLVLRIMGRQRCRILVRTLALLAVFRCRKIYFHSVLRMYDNRFGRLMYIPGLCKVIDIHGVVPEEFRFHNDFYSAVLYEGQERIAVRKSNLVIVVTEAMKRYLQQKYREDLRAEVAVFPMFPNVAPCLGARPYVDGKPVVVYAGGLHKWQQVPKMIDAIVRTSHLYSYRFYCPDPDKVRSMLPESLRDSVIVERKSHEELMEIYSQCHYGFILREDIVVNHVACPTKLVEYLAMGIVPIVDCEDIGDFKSFGMRFIRLQELLAGYLPSEEERQEMAVTNFAIYERLREIRHQGERAIYASLSEGGSQVQPKQRLLSYVKRLLPSDTLRGKLARRVWAALKPNAQAPTQHVGTTIEFVDPVQNTQETLLAADCDILVQVDNFQAGGLENVVLDLNEMLIRAGYKVVLLVLGIPGTAVERARKQGMSVIVTSPQVDNYRVLLEQVKPRLVLAHYSIHGVEVCSQLDIPFIQVIHNTYMWFDEAQMSEFSRAAKMTTAFIAVSEYAKRYSVARLGVESAKCIVIPNGIDCSSFDSLDFYEARRQIRNKYGFSDDEFVFLSVGSINHQKNHLATVRAFASIIGECPNARLILLGPVYETQLLDEIESYIAKCGLAEKVLYTGSTQNTPAYYAMADAFVSAAFFEGGPLTLLEAIRANLPVVIPEVGLATYFRGLQGFEIIAPPFDIVEYRGRIWEMASTPDFEQRLGAAMIRTYIKRQRPNLPSELIKAFDRENTYRCYVELIEDVFNGRDLSGKQFSDTWVHRLAAL